MIRGVILLSIPVLVPVLIWAWRVRRGRREDRSLAIFLLGYVALLGINGVRLLLEDWARSPTSTGDYLAFLIVAIAAGYGVGLLIWKALPFVAEMILAFIPDAQMKDSRLEDAAQNARQRAIEDCAEEIYNQIVENGINGVADYDRLEITAATLREEILQLGKTGRV